jgi:hypothetical protein
LSSERLFENSADGGLTNTICGYLIMDELPI